MTNWSLAHTFVSMSIEPFRSRALIIACSDNILRMYCATGWLEFTSPKNTIFLNRIKFDILAMSCHSTSNNTSFSVVKKCLSREFLSSGSTMFHTSLSANTWIVWLCPHAIGLLRFVVDLFLPWASDWSTVCTWLVPFASTTSCFLHDKSKNIMMNNIV
jgi:hypothetical protein